MFGTGYGNKGLPSGLMHIQCGQAQDPWLLALVHPA